MKQLKMILSALLLFSSNLFAKEDLLLCVVSIDTKEVKVEVTNNHKRSITFPFIGVEKFKKGAWIHIRGDISCPCHSKCAKTTCTLKPKESRTFIWDKDSNKCQKSDGKFRFIIPYYRNQKYTTVHSESFEMRDNQQ